PLVCIGPSLRFTFVRQHDVCISGILWVRTVIYGQCKDILRDGFISRMILVADATPCSGGFPLAEPNAVCIEDDVSGAVVVNPCWTLDLLFLLAGIALIIHPYGTV